MSYEMNGSSSTDEEADLQYELEQGYAEIEQRYAVDAQQGFENVIVIDGTPIVNRDRKDRLVERLKLLFEKAGVPIDDDRIEMPWDDVAETNKGFVFLTYPTAQEAQTAQRVLNKTWFGKAHQLFANYFADIDKYTNMSSGDGALPTGYLDRPFVERENMRSWLADPLGRDQYLTLRDNDANLYWNGRNGVSEVVRKSDGKPVKNNKWGELFCQWSPLGTYLASVHWVGVALWCGPELDGANGVNVLRFTHPGIRSVSFSPCEKYLVTWSPEPLDHPSTSSNASVRMTFAPEDEGNHIVVWDIKNIRVLRTFRHEPRSDLPPGTPPQLKWSPNDKYVARLQPGSAISVYELPSMLLLDKRSLKIDGVQEFEWCPPSDADFRPSELKKEKEFMLAYWTPEAESKPARVNVMSIPSKSVLRSKNLYNVTTCHLYWHNQGKYLCVKVDRHRGKAKSKDKATYCNLEIFRVREPAIPVDVIEHKEYIPSFRWEPYGDRFAIASTSDPNYGQPIPGVMVRYNFSFYQRDTKRDDFGLIKVLEGKTGNYLGWSPKGRHLVIATLGSATKYDIEFWDMDFTTDQNVRAKEGQDPGANITQLALGEHFGINEAPAWDPSGRYLVTVASAYKPTAEPGYSLWDWRGQLLSHVQADKFKQFIWRPRPPSLLSEDQKHKVRKELKEHSRVFDEEDAAEENRGSAEMLASRLRSLAEWNAWYSKLHEKIKEGQKLFGKIVKRKDVGEMESEKVEEWVEELVDDTEEIVA
ncbi:hypothetical protein M231_00577 [Tremella mesenterica]|uniref:Eukaryotic translation initiation factor 3 subunit B n=1 Tax=Tremella mesenterica TaxID=5217 RepID=A0A4Q1BVQ0_TREME|nr:hypothetical protein M231_00577 [Tremella mesenterica]